MRNYEFENFSCVDGKTEIIFFEKLAADVIYSNKHYVQN